MCIYRIKVKCSQTWSGYFTPCEWKWYSPLERKETYVVNLVERKGIHTQEKNRSPGSVCLSSQFAEQKVGAKKLPEKMAFSNLLVVFLACFVVVQCYPRTKFFDYGSQYGDELLDSGDTEQIALGLETPLMYYNDRHYYLYVSRFIKIHWTSAFR